MYLHFFHRDDIDRELHSHPWSGNSVILAGGYREERRHRLLNGSWEVRTRVLEAGAHVDIGPDTFHRVDLLDPTYGCWTLFTTGPRVESWGFWDRDTDVFTPWREQLARRGLLP